MNTHHFHLESTDNLIGFAVNNAKPEEQVKVLTKASVTSDEPEFYTYTEQISNIFLSKIHISPSIVYQILILIHKDLTADVYINKFLVEIEILPKRDFKAGEIVMHNDIADIRSMKFSNIKITESDKVIYCFKVGWKFGLFFDLDRRTKLDVESMSLTLGTLNRYLSFQSIYKVLESKEQFEEMLKDGWFPFIELIGKDFDSLDKAYHDKFDFKNRIERVFSSFDKTRVQNIIDKWWNKQIFKDKKQILLAGINAFHRSDNEGYINCIKTLLTEIEGIIRLQYFSDTGKSKDVKISDLLKYLIEKGKIKSGSDYSLFLPIPFLKYLEDVVFSNFDLATNKIDLSRHSSSHGVAKADDYTKIKALQMILILDQIYFYI